MTVAEPLRVGHVQVELVSEYAQVSPGMSFYVALRMIHDEGWHSYWESSTTGYALSIKWTLPEGIEAGGVIHPVPEVQAMGDIVDYIHRGDVLLPVRMNVSKNFKPGQVAHLKADALWLACSQSCVPGSADLVLDLPVINGAPVRNPQWSARIGATLDSVEDAAAQTHWSFRAFPHDDVIDVYVYPAKVGNPDGQTTGTVKLGALYFFSSDGTVDATPTQELDRDEYGGATLELRLSKYASHHPASIDGILVAANGWDAPQHKALRISLPVMYVPYGCGYSPDDATKGSGPSIAMVLLFGVLGGLLLNLMPCVFPVLGLKVMALIRMAGQGRRAAWRQALIFAAGVMAGLGVLATVILALREAGGQIGWGFQLQDPRVLFVGTVIFLLFGLNMSGVFEVGLSATGAGAELQCRRGLAGAFFTGVLAVVVATPCSAPFLGTAIGFAMVQPALTLLAVFFAVGLGFSLPYLILAAFPVLLRFLPKPGRWMVILKHILALFLYATVAYLLWALAPFATQGADMRAVFASLALVVVAAFVYGRLSLPERRMKVRMTAVAISALLLIAALFIGWPRAQAGFVAGDASLSSEPVAAFTSDEDGPRWTRWRPGLAEDLAGQGNIVWVDFTARWCATCQVNEKLVFSSPQVRQFFREHNVIALKADWTTRDEDISRELARRGRFAVPLNLIYAAGMEPVELPTLLTPGIVMDVMEKVAK